MTTTPILETIGVVAPMMIRATTPDIVAIMTTVVTGVVGTIATVRHIMAPPIRGAIQAAPAKAGAIVGRQVSPIRYLGTTIAGCPRL